MIQKNNNALVIQEFVPLPNWSLNRRGAPSLSFYLLHFVGVRPRKERRQTLTPSTLVSLSVNEAVHTLGGCILEEIARFDGRFS